MKWLVLSLLFGCTAVETSESVDERPINLDAVTLHKALFKAADSRDVQSFASLFTPESVTLLERFFAFVNQLPRPADEQTFGWESLLAQHAALPARARERAPYPIKSVHGKWRIDLVSHPDGRFFSDLPRSRP